MADDREDAKDGAKVHEAFEAVRKDLGDRLGVEEHAAVDGDAVRAREEMATVKDQHGWLHEELVKHPSLATLIDELALWGF
jgi:hypothetical protein